jgi:hypothetical protein
VLVGILGVLLLSILVVAVYCRKILIPDRDSYLSVARLLRTAMNTVEHNSTSLGKKLAGCIDEDNEVRMRYGAIRTTRTIDEEEVYKIDLWKEDDFVDDFPEGFYE